MNPVKENKAVRIFGLLQFVFLCLFVATICLPLQINQPFLIASLFFSLFLFDLQRFRRQWIALLCVTLLYLVALVSLTYSENVTEGVHVLERQLSLLLMPLVYSATLKLDARRMRILLWIFISALATCCLYLLSEFYQDYLVRGSEEVQEFLNGHLHHEFSEPLRMHATYLSIYLCFGIGAASFLFFRGSSYFRFLMAPVVLIFLVSLLFLSSRIIFLPLAITMIFLLPFWLSRRQLMVYFSAVFLGVCAIVLFVSNSTAFIDRFRNDTMRELNISKESDNKMLDLKNISTNDATRAERWKCAIELIRERPWTGYGTGDEKLRLREKYVKYNFTHSFNANFDAHNQYLAYLIKSGIAGLMAFILFVGYSSYRAVLRRDFLHLSLLIIVIFTSLTENILESNKGILFVAFFNTVLLFNTEAYFKRQEYSDSE